MLRVIAWIELVTAFPCMAMVFWPVSRFCSGRPLGFDCESWLIFGVNAFGPYGLLALVCSAWSLRTGKWLPQYLLMFGCAVLLFHWLSHWW